MKIKRMLIGLIFASFGCGVVASIILPVIGFFTGVLLICTGFLLLQC